MRSPRQIRELVKPRKRIKPKKRTAKEFARIYGSEERVEFVKSLSCYGQQWTHQFIDPCEGPIENAHTSTAGMSRKAAAKTIIPLCKKHHRAYDEHRFPFSWEFARSQAVQYAAYVETLWQQFGPS